MSQVHIAFNQTPGPPRTSWDGVVAGRGRVCTCLPACLNKNKQRNMALHGGYCTILIPPQPFFRTEYIVVGFRDDHDDQVRICSH